MYHEIIKHTRKIKDKLEDSKNNENEGAKSSFQEKAKEIITEILIIIFAVSLSTLLHDWSENRTHQNEVKEFLVDIKDDFAPSFSLFFESSNLSFILRVCLIIS